MKRALVLLPALLLAVTSPARSQDILTRQLDAVQQAISQHGYTPDDEVVFWGEFFDFLGFLNSGAKVGIGLDLAAGVEYMFAAACDQDCSDLDLLLMDPRGKTIAEDDLEDDVPVLEFTGPSDETYILWITMYACSAEPCSFAYRVFSR